MAKRLYKHKCLGNGCPIAGTCEIALRKTNDAEWTVRPMFKKNNKGAFISCDTKAEEEN